MSSLYIHYKNKPYKYLGIVRHSETLEEMALYETRYQNQLGKLWVRPKQMFFEEVNGQPRFKKMNFKFHQAELLTDEDKIKILALLNKVFGSYSKEKLNATLQNRKEVFVVMAYDENRFVGFKLGYTYNNERFYSWLGAVDPDYRGVGLAQDMMNIQHDWCQKKDFKVIETRTKNKWQAMLILNLKNGFEVRGTYTNQKGDTKIILEKYL